MSVALSALLSVQCSVVISIYLSTEARTIGKVQKMFSVINSENHVNANIVKQSASPLTAEAKERPRDVSLPRKGTLSH